MKKIHVLLAALALLFAGQAHAAALNIKPTIDLTQTSFNSLSTDLAAATWMTPSNSAESHSAGIIPVGIQAAVEVTSVSVNTSAADWDKVGVSNPSTLTIPRLRLSVGIPFGLDLAYMMTQVPDSNIEMKGFEGRMAFGNYIPVPMLEANIRIHQSSLTGIPDMEIKNSGYGVMIGANLPMVKPYIELGSVTSTSTPSGTLSALTEYKITNNTKALGVKIELALLVINIETAKVGDNDLTSVKLGFEF